MWPASSLSGNPVRSVSEALAQLMAKLRELFAVNFFSGISLDTNLNVL
jgi:hypothetical protein